MIKIQFVCTLLSDIILNQNAGSKEKQSTLDFIPGNVFLGIAAGSLYSDLSADEAMVLFHSGRVRYGDAHPLYEKNRSLRIPAALYYKKGESLTGEGAYVMYKWSPGDSQPKQCRNGFYSFLSQNRCVEVESSTNVAIKSAYDRVMRCSQDEKMYAYESLNKGMRYAFEIECDETVDSRLIDRMKAALVGKRHVGHSKTSQYGLVRIDLKDFESIESRQVHEDDLAVVYADGRLIFIDESGTPTFRPSAQLLGFGRGVEIDWEKSQLRTFQYAPWNAKRHNPDTDRCGIEKGSVFVVKLNGTDSPTESRYVGSYNNEGFGKVIYNPGFLMADDEGKSVLVFKNGIKVEDKTVTGMNVCGSMNPALIKKVKAMANEQTDVYGTVNDFVNRNKNDFKQGDDRFASQWGYIRTLVETSDDYGSFKNALVDYLGHGIAAEKWRYKFDFKKNLNELMDSLSENNWREVMTNLAAEMAKQCKK